MPVDLTPEQTEALAIAAEYRTLVKSAGWKRLWLAGEQRVRDALTAMKNSQSTEPLVMARLQMAWRERELFMDALHTEIQGGLEGRNAVIEEVGAALGASEEEIGQLIEQEEFYGR